MQVTIQKHKLAIKKILVLFDTLKLSNVHQLYSSNYE